MVIKLTRQAVDYGKKHNTDRSVSTGHTKHCVYWMDREGAEHRFTLSLEDMLHFVDYCKWPSLDKKEEYILSILHPQAGAKIVYDWKAY